jgi:sigma-E factor negative regulatory protein RseA
MSIESESGRSALENLSALTDGELDSAATARACAAWRDDPAQRSAWHAYQLIGDVLRSDDLASPAGRDAAFLAQLRTRLAAEPVVLAPEAEPAPAAAQVAVGARRGSRWSWMAPTAVAAGFVLVTGALLVTRAPLPSGSPAQPTLAGGSFGVSPQSVAVPTLAASETPVEPRAVGANGKLMRDPRLDRYLAAHQQFAGTSALGVPSGFLRNAAAEVPNR